MRLRKLIPVLFFTTSLLCADEVVIGWHSFESHGEELTAQSPDFNKKGWVAFMGNTVTDNIAGGDGGGQKVVEYNTKETPDKYGSLYSLDRTPTLASGVMLCANGVNLNIGRLDFKFTNMTDKPVELKSIHFDCKLIYGTFAESWINVSHLSGISDLEDLPWVGLSVSGKLYPKEPIWYDTDVALDKMGDLVLDPGQTAAFRIETGIDGTTPSGITVDNIAVVAVDAQ